MSCQVLEPKNKAEGRLSVTNLHFEYWLALNERSLEETGKKLLSFLRAGSCSLGLVINGILKLLPMTKELDVFFDHR